LTLKLNKKTTKFLEKVERLREQGYSWKEVAEHFKEPEPTIYSRYHKLKLKQLENAA
jgi:hypothetical protein